MTEAVRSAVLLSVILAVAAVPSAAGADDLEARQQRAEADRERIEQVRDEVTDELRELTSEIDEANADLDQSRRTLRAARDRLDELETAAADAARREARASTAAAAALEDAREARDAVVEITGELDVQTERLADRVARAYRHGSTSDRDRGIAHVIGGAGSISELAWAQYHLDGLAVEQQAVVETVELLRNRLDRRRAEAAADSASAHDAARAAGEASEQAQAAVADQQAQRREVVRARDRNQDTLDELTQRRRDLDERRDDLAEQLTAVGLELDEIEDALSAEMVWPAEGRLSSPFGYRTHPVMGTRRLHAGLDIAAPTGTRIVAARAGTVAFAGTRGGYGTTIVLDHGDGLTTLYAHQSRLHVAVGDRVGRGQQIGEVGSTGMSTGPHLHFEVRVHDEPTNPRPYLP